MTAAELQRAANDGAIVLLPVASTEQHGHTFASEAIPSWVAKYVAAPPSTRLAPIVVTPTVWMGLAEHHVAYGGTFSITLSTYHALLRDLCDAILRAGFKKILVVNSHGGNSAALAALTAPHSRISARSRVRTSG